MNSAYQGGTASICPPSMFLRQCCLPRCGLIAAYPSCRKSTWCGTTSQCRSEISVSTSGFYPLGSCTMKFNPKVNELIARVPGFAEPHPLQDFRNGARQSRADIPVAAMACRTRGFAAVSLQPSAGAHGEFTGLLMIRAFHRNYGDLKRTRILIPDSAHGTNPASTTMTGFTAVELPSDWREAMSIWMRSALPATTPLRAL